MLERGRELHPGEYPTTLAEAAGQVQTTGSGVDGQVGDRRQFPVLVPHRRRGMKVLSGCGLGGTSLVNASVSLAPYILVFEDPRWPTALGPTCRGRLRAEG